VNQQVIRRQTCTTAFARAAWPLNRADRFEIQGSARRVGFSKEILTDSYSLGGSLLGSNRRDVSSDFPALYLGATSAAFVHDTSVFRATSPVLGSRARFEVALFADAGVAWTSEEKAFFLGGHRDLLTSAGAALRVNLFGYLIGEVSLAHPFDRPDDQWVWQWSFSPGF
jgi:hypothetical protein